MAQGSAVRGRKDQLALLDRPVLDLALQRHGLDGGAERHDETRRHLHAAAFAILSGFDAVPLVADGALHREIAATPVDIGATECRGFAPAQPAEEPGEDEWRP